MLPTTVTPSSRPQTALLTTVLGRHFNLRQLFGYPNNYDFRFVFGKLHMETTYTGSRARTRRAVGR